MNQIVMILIEEIAFENVCKMAAMFFRALVCQIVKIVLSLCLSSGADMDVCLANYGSCSYVSPRHACIFYDEVGRVHEEC